MQLHSKHAKKFVIAQKDTVLFLRGTFLCEPSLTSRLARYKTGYKHFDMLYGDIKHFDMLPDKI